MMKTTKRFWYGVAAISYIFSICCYAVVSSDSSTIMLQGGQTSLSAGNYFNMNNAKPGGKNQAATPGLVILSPIEAIGPNTKPESLLSPAFYDATIYKGLNPDKSQYKGKYMLCPATPVCPDIYGKTPDTKTGAAANATMQAETYLKNPNCPAICVVARRIEPYPTATSPSKPGGVTTYHAFANCPTGYIPVAAFNPDYDLLNNTAVPTPKTPASFQEMDKLIAAGNQCTPDTKVISTMELGCKDSQMGSTRGIGGMQEVWYDPRYLATRVDNATNNLEVELSAPSAAVIQFTFSTKNIKSSDTDLGLLSDNRVFNNWSSNTCGNNFPANSQRRCFARWISSNGGGFQFWCDIDSGMGISPWSAQLAVYYSPYVCLLPQGWIYTITKSMTAYVCSRPTPARHNSNTGYVDTNGAPLQAP
jgi:hypothetical protein